MEVEQTAVEWLIDQLVNVERLNHINKRMLPISKNSLKEKEFNDLVEQARKMEQLQKETEYRKGFKDGQQYYREEYGNKTK